ncbi:hypothetical protein [Actinomycetospora soli]|uniref:hypothetical protein n=1 Tax=Actinomycetospora soli TaxID=2893887 RepID=UPI001E519CBF|nr:hypothetical protein [Actinomycetospora soli]MCD2186631.1 hypothetical protein [Actinomycetospora soli]
MYRVEPVGEDIAAAIDDLPERFPAAFAELRVALEVAPWSVGEPYHPANPSGSRSAAFGPDERGLVVFAVEDRDRRVVWLWSVLVAPEE